MNDQHKQLLKRLFSGKNNFTPAELKELSGLRDQIPKIGVVDSMGISLLYSVNAESFEKHMSEAGLKTAKAEYARLSHPNAAQHLSIEGVLEIKGRMDTALMAGHKSADDMVWIGSPERKINNLIRDVGIRDARITMNDIKHAGGCAGVSDATARLDMCIEQVHSRRSWFDGKTGAFLEEAVQFKTEQAKLSIGKATSHEELRAVLNDVNKVSEYASGKQSKEYVAEVKTLIKASAITAIKDELGKATPSLERLSGNLKVVKSTGSFSVSEKAELKAIKEQVAQVKAAQKGPNNGMVSTIMSTIEDVMTQIRGAVIGKAAGGPGGP